MAASQKGRSRQRRRGGAKRMSEGPIDRPGPGDRQVIGLHACRETIKKNPDKVKSVWLRQGGFADQSLSWAINWARENMIPLQERSAGQLDELGSGHQGLALLVEGRPLLDKKKLAEATSCVLLALDEVEDPQNLGSILRSAWLFGASGLLLPERRSSHLSPSVHKVASGGAEHVPIEVVKNLPQSLMEWKELGFWVYGLAGEGHQSLWAQSLPEKLIWVVGAESKGLRASVRKSCDEIVRIPMVDSGSSLNAATAMAIALAEATRQRGS